MFVFKAHNNMEIDPLYQFVQNVHNQISIVSHADQDANVQDANIQDQIDNSQSPLIINSSIQSEPSIISSKMSKFRGMCAEFVEQQWKLIGK